MWSSVLLMPWYLEAAKSNYTDQQKKIEEIEIEENSSFFHQLLSVQWRSFKYWSSTSLYPVTIPFPCTQTKSPAMAADCHFFFCAKSLREPDNHTPSFWTTLVGEAGAGTCCVAFSCRALRSSTTCPSHNTQTGSTKRPNGAFSFWGAWKPLMQGSTF